MSDRDQELFEKLWHPICPQFDSINSSHVYKLFQALLEHCKQGEEYWLYEIDVGKGVFQGCTGKDAEKVVSQTSSAFEGSGKPFRVFTHAMPKSEGKPEPDAEIIRGNLYPWKNKQIPYMAKVYFDTSLSTPQPSTDVSELRKQVEMVRDLKKTQCTHGNYNYSPYMLGMANAFILAMSVFDGGRPEYLHAPKVWGEDLPMPEKSEIDGGTHSSPSTP